jgi:hypothetical protein
LGPLVRFRAPNSGGLNRRRRGRNRSLDLTIPDLLGEIQHLLGGIEVELATKAFTEPTEEVQGCCTISGRCQRFDETSDWRLIGTNEVDRPLSRALRFNNGSSIKLLARE